jgi:toxin ParE1/3/4
MAQYNFTGNADLDLEPIVDDTHQTWGALQTNKYIDGLAKIAQTLAENPDVGANRESISPGLRSLPYKSHIFYYLNIQQGVSIVRVLHSNMDSAHHLVKKKELEI